MFREVVAACCLVGLCPAIAEGAPPSSAATHDVYVVRRGDTIRIVAKRFGLSPTELLEANPEVQDRHRILRGQKLRIPGRQRPKASARKAAKKPSPRATNSRRWCGAKGKQTRALVFADQVSDGFLLAVLDVAKRLEMDPNHLLAVIHFETAGTFSPRIQNPTTRATGLIQFLPHIARRLGTSIPKLKAMTATAQLVYVEKYLRPFRGRMRTIGDAYLAVFLPSALKLKPGAVMYREGSTTYARNKGHDKNKDGVVRRSEITASSQARLALGYKRLRARCHD